MAAMVTLTFSPTLASALAGVTVTALGASGTTGASGTSTKVIVFMSVRFDSCGAIAMLLAVGSKVEAVFALTFVPFILIAASAIAL